MIHLSVHSKGTILLQADSGGSAAPPPNRLGPFLSKLSGTLAPLLFLLILSVVLSFLSPHFASRDNFKQILIQAAVVAILACGQTAVIISGNIDLSVGAVMAFAGVAAAQAMSLASDPHQISTLPTWSIALIVLPAAALMSWPVRMALGKASKMVGAMATLLAFLAAEILGIMLLKSLMLRFGVNMWGGVAISCASGLSAGILTGLLTAYGKIPSFIVTLGMMGVAYGMGGIISHSQTISGLSPGFEVFGTKELFGTADRDGIPYAVLILLFVAVCVFIALARSRWGRNLYAIGGNREAARLSGVPIDMMITTVFALSGLLAGIAAVLNVSRTSVAQYTAGEGLELYAVAATVIGGTSLFGGQGGVPGTIIGALLMFTIKNGCNLLGVGSEIERAVIGAVVILAVLYDRYILPLVRHGVERMTAGPR